MAKSSYGIRASLDRSWWDLEISISTKKTKIKPLPMKFILWNGGMATLIIVAFIKGVFSGVPFIISAWFLATMVITMIYFGRPAQTNEMKFKYIPALLEYVPGPSRRVMTRLGSKAGPFYGIVGIKVIHPNGLIEYSDGSYGQAFRVAGSASLLLFDDDRDAVVNRVEAFWRKMSVDVEMMFITTRQPQRIGSQVKALQERYRVLLPLPGGKTNIDMQDLLNEDFDVIRSYVGKRFRSVQQYLVVRASSEEALQNGVQMVINEWEESSFMFSYLSSLRQGEVINMLKPIYEGPGSYTPDRARRWKQTRQIENVDMRMATAHS